MDPFDQTRLQRRVSLALLARSREMIISSKIQLAQSRKVCSDGALRPQSVFLWDAPPSAPSPAEDPSLPAPATA
jgi:hypothetical protein